MSALVRIKDTEEIAISRSLYQLHENILVSSFNYLDELESYHTTILIDYMEIDITRWGKPLRIEVKYPKKEWVIDKGLSLPVSVNKGIVFFDQEQEEDLDGKYYSNYDRDCLYIQFLADKNKSIQIASGVIVDVFKNEQLAGIWINNISNDLFYVKEAITGGRKDRRK